MKKITVVKIADIGTQVKSMTDQQLVEFFKAEINNPYIVEDFAMGTKVENTDIEDVPELIAIKIAAEPNIVLINNKQDKPISLFLANGYLMKDGLIRPIYNQMVDFNSIGICSAGRKNCVEEEFVPADVYRKIMYIREYNKLFKEIELAGKFKPVPAGQLIEDEEPAKAPPENKLPWAKFNSAQNTYEFIDNMFYILDNYNIFQYIIEEKYEEIEDLLKSKLNYEKIVAKEYKKIYSDQTRQALYNKIVSTKFGNKKLSEKEQKYVEAEIKRFYEYNEFVETNKCQHIRVYNKLRKAEALADKKYWLDKIKEFINPADMKRSSRVRGGGETLGIINCSVCSRMLMCTHTYDMINMMSFTTTPEQLRNELAKYIDMDIETHNGKYYCKFCGEYLYDEESINAYSDFKNGIPAETTDIEEILWREIRTVLNNVRFNIDTSRKNKLGVYQIDPQKFIRQGIDILIPWMEVIKRKESRNKTLAPEDLISLLDVHGAIYAIVLIVVLSIYDPLIELMKPKINGRNQNIISKTLTEYIMTYKGTQIRKLDGVLNANVINSKITTTYAIMINAYKGANNIADNLTEEYRNIIEADPIANQLKFTESINQIVLSKNPNIYNSLVIPNFYKLADVGKNLDHFSGAIVRIIAENYKAGTWPPDFTGIGPLAEEININQWEKHAIAFINPDYDKKEKLADFHISKFYNTEGYKYEWTTYVFQVGDKELDFRPNQSDTLPAEAVMIDMKTKDGVRLSEIQYNDEEVSQAMTKKYVLNEFFNKIESYCPAGEMHDFVKGVCKKCGFDENWSAKSKEFAEFAEKNIKEKQTISAIRSPAESAKSYDIVEYKEDSLALKEFADYADFDLAKLKEDAESFYSRDDTRIISLISFMQTLLSDWRDFQIAANKSELVPFTTGPNMVEYYRQMIGEKSMTKLANLPADIIKTATSGRMTLPIEKVYQFLSELLAKTFIKCEKIFIAEKMKKFIKMNDRTVKLANWDKWESTTATIIKVMSAETSEEKQANRDPNEFELSAEVADENEKDKAFGNNYDMDNEFDNEDNT